MLTLKEELLLGAFVMFLEDGTTVDLGTVAIDSLPDDVPTTNWTDFRLGCIERVKITPTTKSFPRSCPREAGGFNEDPKIVVTGWIIEMTVDSYSEFIHRLQMGSTAPVVDGVAFTPFAKGVDLKITGWLRIEAKDETGVTKVNLIDWADMRLTNIPEWKNEYGKPVLQFTILGDDNGGLSTCVVNAA